MSKRTYRQLSSCCKYAEKRISAISVSTENYITTDNMLPHRKGVETAKSVPDSKTFHRYDPEDILISNIRPYFQKIWFANKIGGCSADVLVLETNDSINKKFLYYVLSDSNFFNYATVTSKGTKMPRGTKSAIMRYLVPDISLSAQKQIADILSAYDDLIENNLARISLLEKMVSEIYKEWFVRFRFPGHETAKFVGRIPERWEYVPLKDILTFSRGVSYSSEELTDDVDGCNLINLKNISAYGGFNREGTKKYRGNYKESQIVKSGDLVMGITDMTQDRRTVGSVALIPPLDGVSVISADLLKINSEIDNIFLYCLCKYGYYSKYFSMFANGANVLHLRPDMLYSRKILLPPIELINEFVSLVSPLFDGMNAYHKQNEILIKQRDLLLPRLMSGKLSVEPLLSETA